MDNFSKNLFENLVYSKIMPINLMNPAGIFTESTSKYSYVFQCSKFQPESTSIFWQFFIWRRKSIEKSLLIWIDVEILTCPLGRHYVRYTETEQPTLKIMLSTLLGELTMPWLKKGSKIDPTWVITGHIFEPILWL